MQAIYIKVEYSEALRQKAEDYLQTKGMKLPPVNSGDIHPVNVDKAIAAMGMDIETFFQFMDGVLAGNKMSTVMPDDAYFIKNNSTGEYLKPIDNTGGYDFAADAPGSAIFNKATADEIIKGLKEESPFFDYQAVPVLTELGIK